MASIFYRSKTILQCAHKPTDLVNRLQSPTPHTPQTGSVTSAEGERRLWLERCGQKVSFETRIETSTLVKGCIIKNSRDTNDKKETKYQAQHRCSPLVVQHLHVLMALDVTKPPPPTPSVIIFYESVISVHVTGAVDLLSFVYFMNANLPICPAICAR